MRRESIERKLNCKTMENETKFIIGTLLVCLAFAFLIMPLAKSEVQSLPPVRQYDCINLPQYCPNSTYSNISTIRYPNGSEPHYNYLMTKIGDSYNYSFCRTTNLGSYIVNGICDPNGNIASWAYDFDVTESGNKFDLSQTVLLISLFAMMGLFFAIGLTFRKEKWKLRTFFFIFALLMGVILLNSVRLMIGTSTELASMGQIAVILGIIVLSFIVAYFLILYTIEVFFYFKKRKNMSWEVGTGI